MAALSEFHKLIAPEVPGCPQPVMNEAILRACIEFCERTSVTDETVTVATVAATAEYALTFTTGYTAHRLIYVRRSDNTELTRSSREIFDVNTGAVEAGDATHYYLSTAGKLVLGPIPDAIETLTVKAVTKPTRTATTVADSLADHWGPAIAAGAKALLYAQKGTAWYDPNEAAQKETDFSGAINLAIAQRNAGRSGTQQMVTMRPAA